MDELFKGSIENRMKTEMSKETIDRQSSPSYLLAKRARIEQMQNGKVSVICPRCNEKPVVNIIGNNERIYVRCKCGYIADGEIYF
ncbi:MAG: hypothetical protein IJ079_03585 [Lachnospiraceae bacterium]|nr:hypothetical protein [Lachnospiraceae bacterium]